MGSNEVIDLFSQKETFLLLIHHCPDGDAIASSLALGMALRFLGKQVDIVCADPIPQAFRFLPTVHKVKHDFLSGDYEVIVTLDCGDSRRTGFSERIKELVRKNNKLLVNIDHHPKNDLHSLATHNIVDYSAPSTTYIVYQIIKSLEVPIDHK
ncbi:MAG TPA: DHH family phosphoesterase, partial [Patescibacteria group bacterium]